MRLTVCMQDSWTVQDPVRKDWADNSGSVYVRMSECVFSSSSQVRNLCAATSSQELLLLLLDV